MKDLGPCEICEDIQQYVRPEHRPVRCGQCRAKYDLDIPYWDSLEGQERLRYLASTTEDATQNSLDGEQVDDDKVEADR